MSKIKKLWDMLFSKVFAHKFLAYFLLILFLYIFKNFVAIFLLTFIFSYLFFSIAEFLKKYIDIFFDKHLSNPIILKNIFHINILIIFVYVSFITIIIFIFSWMIPKLISELSALHKTIPFVADYVNQVLAKLNELKEFNNEIWDTIWNLAQSQDFSIFVDILAKLKSFSIVFFKWVLSLFLSFVFLLDRKRLSEYLLKIKKSNFNFLYKEYKIIFDKVLKSFWVIIKAQATIAFVNTILTAIWLIVIWFINSGNLYPYFLTLILLVFLAGFIPILWTFISSVPIIIVWYAAFPERWYSIIIEITILITIIHMVESYFLNPKIVSKAISIPISLTFIILLLSEELFWMAWLIIWMSLFYFIIWIFSDINWVLAKKWKNK